MMKVYVDNSATSYPKAPGVSDAIKDFIDTTCCNINRGDYDIAYDTSYSVLEARGLVCELFHYENPNNVVFTPNVTYSLNMIINGFIKEGDHAIVTSMEHNAVMRPVSLAAKRGAFFDRVKCAPDGSLNPSDILPLIKPNTKAVIMTHASNVCGTVLPIEEVSEICRSRGLRLIVDAAQSAGTIDCCVGDIDAFAFTGHKGLLAAHGIGGFIIKDDFSEQITPIIVGATGSAFEEELHPDFLPDKFESGTSNIPGILGLRKSLQYILEYGIDKILEKELLLTERFLDGVRALPGVKIIGKDGVADRLAVVSLDFAKRDNDEISYKLSKKYGIMTRCGMHCSPSAHKTLGTYPGGTVRFSFGHFNTVEEIDYIISSLKEIVLYSS